MSFSPEVIPWWEKADEFITALRDHPSFKDADFLFPAFTKNFDSFIPRPCGYSAGSSCMKEALRRVGVPRALLEKISLHGWRALINEWGFQLLIDKSLRKYLGNWQNEDTSEVYTREKREVISKIWNIIFSKREELRTCPASVRLDFEHPDWSDESAKQVHLCREAVKLSDSPLKGLPFREAHAPVIPDAEASGSGEVREKKTAPPTFPVEVAGQADPDVVPAPIGPLQVYSGVALSGVLRLHKVHLFTNPRTALTFKGVGCGWTPLPYKVEQLSVDDWQAEPSKYDFCKNCWSRYAFPSSWKILDSFKPPEAKTGVESDSSSSDCPSNDSESEEEGHSLS